MGEKSLLQGLRNQALWPPTRLPLNVTGASPAAFSYHCFPPANQLFPLSLGILPIAKSNRELRACPLPPSQCLCPVAPPPPARRAMPTAAGTLGCWHGPPPPPPPPPSHTTAVDVNPDQYRGQSADQMCHQADTARPQQSEGGRRQWKSSKCQKKPSSEPMQNGATAERNQ